VLSEGECAVPSLIEALEARQTEVLGQVERLREQIAGLTEEFSRAEERLSRLQILNSGPSRYSSTRNEAFADCSFAQARSSC
jgi:chromosome segregation ATPase